jgi:ketosteroid isomerase-like protein
MKNLIAFLSVVVLFSLNACTEKINFETEKERARTVLEQYHKALEIEDMEMISTLYAHDDDIVQFNDVGKVIGWEVIKTDFQDWFEIADSINFTFRDEIIKVHNSGNAAWISFIQDGNIIFRDKPSSFKDTRATWALKKLNDNWVIVQSHFSVPSEESLVE